MPSIYKLDYDGGQALQCHDGHSDLRRWFDNYKLNHQAEFAGEYEWLTIEEKKLAGTRRAAVRYVGTIGDVEANTARRTVLFETNAPAPPTFHRPAKFLPEPKPVRSRDSGTLTYDMLRDTMDRIGMPHHKQRDLAIQSRTYYEFEERVQLEKLKFEMSRVTSDASLWASLHFSHGPIIMGIDFGVEPKRPIPPPKRYRRNA